MECRKGNAIPQAHSEFRNPNSEFHLPSGKNRLAPLESLAGNPPRELDLSEKTMAKKSGKRKKKVETVFLVCAETGEYNYTIRRRMGGEKLRLKKYCPRLRRHTEHVEKKK